jgi:hypothetical protein
VSISITPQGATIAGEFNVGKIAVARPALHERADKVNQQLEGLDAVLAHLFDRLEPVLRPSLPTPPPSEVPPAVVRDRMDDDSWLSEYLTSTQDRIQGIANRMRYLADRVDL